MKLARLVLTLLVTAAAAGGCNGKVLSSRPGSETNWLKCSLEGECDEGYTCQHTLCVPDIYTVKRPGAITVAADPAATVGNPCILDDESRANFQGYDAIEVNIEGRTSQCEGGVCLANHFRGRVTCPEGQSDPSRPSCFTLTGDPITVPVPPQLPDRPAEKSVYCSCRCDGRPQDGPFCTCPDGYDCADIASYGAADAGDTGGGSYCVKKGT